MTDSTGGPAAEGSTEGRRERRPDPVLTDHGGGVWSIPVPIPDNPLGHTLVHLLDTDRGPVLIDTGWDDPASWDALAQGLAACGTSPEELYGVLITHHHPDHHGLSRRVRESGGAWIAMHEADSRVVAHGTDARADDWYGYLLRKLAAAGAPEDHLAPLRTVRGRGGSRGLPGLGAAVPDRTIPPGELLDLPGRRLRAVWTPGHTPGHVCLHLEEEHPSGLAGNGRLFSGDHLLPRITPHIGLYGGPDSPDDVDSDPLGDYLHSLDRIAGLGVAEVLPAHQYAFTDAAGRAAQLREHHEERLREMHALISARPMTAWELAERSTWNRAWADLPYIARNIALSETEAHIRRLVKQCKAEPVTSGEVVSFTAAG